jgi:hypothetical protein
LRRAIFATIALSLGLAVAAILLEVGVLLTVGEQPKFPRHVVGAHFGLRVNEPNAHYRHKSVWFQINAQGMRADRDFAREKPPGLLRIVSLGDSFTVGYEVAAEESFSSVLEAELRKAGLQVEVMNAGVSGYSNAEECGSCSRTHRISCSSRSMPTTSWTTCVRACSSWKVASWWRVPATTCRPEAWATS